MKKTARVLIMVLCLTLVAPAFLTMPASYAAGETTKKKGLVKENGKYYYYKKDGVKLKNSWKTITNENGSKDKYYFGTNGAAYAAPKDSAHKKVIVVKTINDVKYGFLANGKCVSGIYCNADCKVYCFKSNGKLNEDKTKKLRKLSKEGKDPKALLDLLGKAKKTRKSDSCYGEGTDIDYYDPNVRQMVFKSSESGKNIVLGFVPR